MIGGVTFGSLVDKELTLSFGENTIAGKSYSREKKITLTDTEYSVTDNNVSLVTLPPVVTPPPSSCTTFMV